MTDLKGCNHDDIIESNISGILPHNRVYESFLFKNAIVIEA